MGTTALDQAKEYLVEEQGLLKMPGYYDLWKASVEVEQGLPLLQRVFGSQLTPRLLEDMDRLMKLIRAQ